MRKIAQEHAKMADELKKLKAGQVDANQEESKEELKVELNADGEPKVVELKGEPEEEKKEAPKAESSQ